MDPFALAETPPYIGTLAGTAAGLAAGAWLAIRFIARRPEISRPQPPRPQPTQAPLDQPAPPQPPPPPAPPAPSAAPAALPTASLRLAHRQLEAAFESLPVPTALLADGGRILSVNRRWRDLQQSADWPIPELRTDEDVGPEAHAAFGPLLTRSQAPRSLSANPHWTLHALQSSDPRANITILYALPANSPDQRGHEHQFLSKILETTAALILVLDDHGRILTFNDACRRLTGFSGDEVLGRPFWETVIPPEDRERLQAGFARLISTGEPRPFENPWIDKEGRRHTVLWSNAVTRANDGSVARVICTGIDVTDTRRMQHELVQAQRMEAIGQLAGGIAHDFNNLLTAIFGHTALAKRLIPASHEAFPSLERVEQAAEQAGRVIRSLLTFSRTERSDKAPLPVAALLQDTASLIRGLLPATIELRTFPVPPNLWIEADRLQIQQAILNLAINARDSMPAGGTLRLSAAQAPGPCVAFIIEDSGQGIPREILPRVFEPFFTTKPKSSGGGLGLPVAKSIATDHGGTLTLASEPGVGTRATLSIPLSTPPAATAALESPGALRLLVASPRSYPRQIMVSALAALGAPVQGFSSAEHFAAEVRSAPEAASVAICDTAVIAAVPGILAAAADRRIPVLVLGDPAGLADLPALGAAILAEPFTTAQLLQAVRRLIDAARRPEETLPAPR